MAHFKKKMQMKNEGKIVYGSGIIDSIVYHALSDVPYIQLYSITPSKKGKSSIDVHFDKEGVHIDIYVKIHFSQTVNDMAFKIQETIRHNIENMTDYKISDINVIVKGLLFDDVSVHEKLAETSNKEKETEVETESANNAEKDTSKWEV